MGSPDETLYETLFYCICRDFRYSAFFFPAVDSELNESQLDFMTFPGSRETDAVTENIGSAALEF